MATDPRYAQLAKDLQDLLGVSSPPLAITFRDEAPEGVEPFGAPLSAPSDDGRRGAVPAGCAFWMHAAERTFSTTAEDHGNCSVGSVTHGLLSLEQASKRGDVAALVEAEWVRPEDFGGIPTVSEEPGAIVYGPLAETPVEPDVVFLRLNGKQAMMLHDAWPDIRLEGKPQCHIIPMAKEQGQIALSVGCMLSRVRTGMSNHEVTCAVPAAELETLVERLRASAAADKAVAGYAAEDAKRFS